MSRARRAAAAVERWLDDGGGGPHRGRTIRLGAAAYAVFVATWVPINAFSVGRQATTLYLPGEAALPFIPEFEYLYALGYVLPVIALLAVPTARGVVRLLAAFLGTLAVAYATYLVFPVYLERPEMVVDSVSTFLLSLEYLDPSYNHFPSLHVALVWLGWLAARDGLRWTALYVATAIGMTVATMFVKQHYFVDLVSGAALAAVSWTAAGYWLRRASATELALTEETAGSAAEGGVP